MVKITLKNFKKELQRVSSEVLQLSNAGVNLRTRSLATNLVQATPIRTGFARSKWDVVHHASKERPFTIINNAPYIERLNGGSSKQAPANFVESIALKYGRPVGAVVRVVNRPENKFEV